LHFNQTRTDSSTGFPDYQRFSLSFISESFFPKFIVAFKTMIQGRNPIDEFLLGIIF
jgi:hypothetical protein